MTLLIGVAYGEKLTELVIQRLSGEYLEDYKVMLEIFSYPITDEFKKRVPSFAKNVESIAEYVLDRKGKLVFGEDEDIYYKAVQEYDELDQRILQLQKEQTKIWGRRQELSEHLSVHEKERRKESLMQEYDDLGKEQKPLLREQEEAILRERHPHFAKVVNEENPDIVVFDYRHIPYLIEHCFLDNNYSLCVIPSSKLVSLLKGEKVN